MKLEGVTAAVDSAPRHRRLSSRVALGIASAGALGILGWLLASGAASLASVAALVLGLIWLVAWGSWASDPNRDKAVRDYSTVELNNDALIVHGDDHTLSTRADEVTSSWVRRIDDDGMQLVLHRSDHRLVVVHGVDRATRREIEDRLHCGVRHNKTEMLSETLPHDRGRGCLQPIALIMLLGAAAYIPWVLYAVATAAWLQVGGATLAAALSLAFAWLQRQRAVVAGHDGVRVPTRWASRFVPLSEIASAKRDRIELVDGEKVALPHPVEGLALRIEELKSQADALANPIDASELQRGERSADEWRRALLAARKQDGYRERGWTQESLLALTEDAQRTPEERVAAAVAASAGGGEEARRRVRIAARTSADPDLEAALEAAAELEILDDELARAQRRHGGDESE